MCQSGKPRGVSPKLFLMLTDIIFYIFEAIAFLCFLYILGKAILFYWALLHMFDDHRYGSVAIVNPNGSDFFPNFDLFKKKVMEMERRDLQTRLYLLSRKNRLNRIKMKKDEGKAF